QLLFHDAGRPEIDRVERGRDLHETHRCQACHQRENDPPPEPAPALVQVASSLDRTWLTAWLVEPSKEISHARMPGFGFSRDDATAIAAYFFQQPAAEGGHNIPAGDDDREEARR